MMNKILIILLLFIVASCSSSIDQKIANKVYVLIDYGMNDQVLESEIDYHENLTALEALQRVVVVETKPVGDYVFVSKIDTITNVKDDHAWYYKVNGISAKVLAIDNVLNAGDTLLWINKTDLCSK